MPAGRSKVVSTSNALIADGILSFSPDSFSVGSNSTVNDSGTQYYWTALKAGANLTVGTYTGNGTDNRDIIGMPFQPDWVMVMGDGELDYFRPGPLAGDASFRINSAGANANRIQAFLPDGFQVGSNNNVNESGRNYYWLAFDATAKVVVSTYTGDATDNRNITGLGITPAFVWVKRGAGSSGVFRLDQVSGDATLYWDSTSPTTNRIQALFAGGFQVGSHAQVNSATGNTTYYYLALTP